MLAKAPRRHFTAEYKQRILKEAEADNLSARVTAYSEPTAPTDHNFRIGDDSSGTPADEFGQYALQKTAQFGSPFPGFALSRTPSLWETPRI